jgi:ferrous iron transport protein B
MKVNDCNKAMEIKRIALIGNPNTGKSSVFNHLTGLNQTVGNFPGVTVDKKTGTTDLPSGKKIEVLDLPGIYSIFPRSKDERIVLEVLKNKQNPNHPDAAVVIADASNLKRNLLLFTQVYDVGMPLVLVLTMNDIALQKGIQLDVAALEKELEDVKIVFVNGRTGDGIAALKQAIEEVKINDHRRKFGIVPLDELALDKAAQSVDAHQRFAIIKQLLLKINHQHDQHTISKATLKLDKILVHPFFGYAIFIGILLLVFQFIFSIASYPMEWIDGSFLKLSQWAQQLMPKGIFTDLVSQGIIPGIGGVLVFVPQIALLFFFMAILEETGYMSRVVFIMDKLVRPFGLNGKSVVPLMSSVACAIPGIMAARTISSWKDRIITIMVAPLMSCSARIPVYTLLIALVIPNTTAFGFFNLQGLVLFMLYTLGLVSALLVAAVMKYIIKSTDRSFLIMELPTYKSPRWGHVALNIWEKVRIFIFDAGKVILAISILLWALASYGPNQRTQEALAQVEQPSAANSITQEEYERQMNAVKLENSYIGILGKTIEPAIAPLGFDWKIGISLITSFAAREVFVGSMATIYSVNEDFENDDSLMTRLKNEVNPQTGMPVYTMATGISLMIFYVYAMQCMATLAIVKRETKSWKWPLIQLVYMGILAYLSALVVYNIFK